MLTVLLYLPYDELCGIKKVRHEINKLTRPVHFLGYITKNYLQFALTIYTVLFHLCRNFLRKSVSPFVMLSLFTNLVCKFDLVRFIAFSCRGNEIVILSLIVVKKLMNFGTKRLIVKVIFIQL